MNTGQSLFSVGALLLLSLSILRVNNSILTTDTIMQDSKLGVLGISLATSLIEEANRKAFDASSAEDAVDNLGDLTPPNSLGPGFGETPDLFNDFDDYNGYTKLDTINTIDYKLNCTVNYVTPADVDGISSLATWHKNITVLVSSSFMNDTLSFSSVYSYWHFR